MPERITRAQLVEVFGGDGLAPIPAENLPAGITDEFTRSFLTSTGIPTNMYEDVIEISEDLTTGLRGLGEVEPFSNGAWEIPEGFSKFYYLGNFFGSFYAVIALDGATGQVHAIPEARAVTYVLNSDVECLAFYMYTFTRHRELYSSDYYDEHNDEYEGTDTNTYAEAGKLIEAELRAHDPAPFTAAGTSTGDETYVWSACIEELSSGLWD